MNHEPGIMNREYLASQAEGRGFESQRNHAILKGIHQLSNI